MVKGAGDFAGFSLAPLGTTLFSESIQNVTGVSLANGASGQMTVPRTGHVDGGQGP